ncbi:hypothetical protein BCR42DRAFT_423808 [Absidia repens]|uniref:HTH APSES-type domain-containing protein n=1 Tax=Absidia repens TaxID=90262 RepID=A0A1X2I5J4_9FUNG|nr:hypothetical protein BCR42DRAFT_423808 [Absidia repens]
MSQQIYKATYSGVPVYEISCNGVAVMRRRNDSYMNATQILKVADFDKPQRTRILEREVQIDEHEKIQGGYGKYQGTWVPLDKAVRLAMNYSVDDLIRPLLNFVKGDESPPLAPKHVTAASVKPRKPRERRTRKKAKHLEDDVSDINDDSGLSAKEEPSHHTQTPSPRRQHRRTTATRTKMNTQLDYMETGDSDELDTKLTGKKTPSTSKTNYHQQQQVNKPSHADQHTQSSSNSPLSSPNLSSSASTPPPPPPPMDRTPTTKYKTKKGLEHERTYAHKLLAHFLSENEDIPALLQRPPRDLDVNVIIDEEGHTCLHWAAVMGHMKTVQQLYQLEADLYRVNYKGQTALMRSVLYTNNYDQKTFDQLLGILSGTIFNIDKSDQTVFHHVAATAKGKGKIHASRYYMENLINKLAHNRSELISILNVQDVCGDTALTIASRIGNRKLVRLLIDAGASTEIANEEGMTAQDYLATLDQHSADIGGMDGDIPVSAAKTASPYQSEEMTREQVRQKVDTMYKAMLSGNTLTTTPSLSRWIDDLASKNTIKEKQRDTELVIERLNETKKSLDLLAGDQHQQVQEVLGHGDRLLQELRQVLFYTQEIRLGRWIKEREDNPVGDTKDIPSTSTTATQIPKSPTPPNINTTTNADSIGHSSSEISTIASGNNYTGIRFENREDKTTLETQLSQLQQTRRELMNDVITHRTNICDKRIQNYKRLISMCCNITYENVDSMLAPILASFDDTGTVKSTKDAIATTTF